MKNKFTVIGKHSRAISQQDQSTLPSIHNQSKLSLPSLKMRNNQIQWVYQDDYDFMIDQKNIFRLNEDESSPYVNRKFLAVKQLQSVDTNDIEDIEERFNIILKYLRQTKVGNLYNVSVLIYAYIMQKHHQYNKAIVIWQKFLVFANAHRAFKYKIIAYKHLSELCINMRQFRRALNYCKKLLKYALYANELEHELSAYDQIGKVYYYMKQGQIAKAFHERFTEGQSFAHDDETRIAIIKRLEYDILQRQQLSQIDTDSEDDFDIEKIVKPRNLELNHIKLREELHNERHLWAFVRRESLPLGPTDGIIVDQKLFQKQFFTQHSNNQSVKNFLVNNAQFTLKNNLYKLIDRLMIDIQQF